MIKHNAWREYVEQFRAVVSNAQLVKFIMKAPNRQCEEMRLAAWGADTELLYRELEGEK